MYVNAIFIAVLISQCATGHGVKPERPTFSDTFTVGVEAIFAREVEIDATLYYDGPNNRAVIDMLYQNEATKKIYLFDDDKILSISAPNCNTEPITEDSSSFNIAFSVNKTTGKKTIALPEEVFHFQNSEFDIEGFDEFQPLHIYKGKTNIYGQKNCDVSHGFTKSDFSMANCELRSCKSTLRSIILRCLNIPNDEEVTEIYNRYDLFRFRNVIDDYEIFQPDKGIFCKGLNAATTKVFHVLPKFINFSYDVFLRQTDIPTIAKGQNVEHHTLWYDDDIKLARVDKHEENGRFLERKIYDFKNDIIYETLKDQKCIKSTTPKSLTLEEATTLPQIIFPLTSTEKEEKPVYIGQRMTQGFEYDVWSSQKIIGDDEIRFVREFYFIKKYGEVNESDEYKLQLSFIQQYAYGNKDNTKILQLQEGKAFYLNHVSTSPRELIAFHVSDCFDPEEKLSFEIEISGRTFENFNRKQFMEAFFLKLLTISKLSAVRIGSLKIVHQTKNTTSLTGVITENFTKSTSKSKELADKSEPDMTTAFDNLKSEVTEKKKFSFNLMTASQGNLKFQATYFGEPRKYIMENLEGEVSYTGGAMGALAIVMLGIGAIIGGIGVFIYNKTRPKRESMIDLPL